MGSASSSLPKKAKIHDCLKAVDISEAEKARLTKNFSESVVKVAVAHCTQESFKPEKNLFAAIWYFAKNPDHITPSKAQIQKEKQKKAEEEHELQHMRHQAAKQLMKHAWKHLEKKTDLSENHEYLEAKGNKIYYSDKNFKNLVEHYFRKYNWPLPAWWTDFEG